MPDFIKKRQALQNKDAWGSLRVTGAKIIDIEIHFWKNEFSAKNHFWKNEKPGHPMVECPGEVFISVILFEFRVKQCGALHGEVLHPLYFQFVCTCRHVRLVAVLIVEIPDTEIGGNGLAHLFRLFVKF